MGQVVNLYGANFTDSRLPILYNYPGLNPGSLFLLDAVMIDPDFNFSATGTTVYTDNLAAEVAAELTGKTAADLQVAWNNTLVTTGSAPEAKFERTAKGGSRYSVTGESGIRSPWAVYLPGHHAVCGRTSARS